MNRAIALLTVTLFVIALGAIVFPPLALVLLLAWLVGSVIAPCLYLDKAYHQGVPWFRRTSNAALVLMFWPIIAMIVLYGRISRPL